MIFQKKFDSNYSEHVETIRKEGYITEDDLVDLQGKECFLKDKILFIL